MTTIETRNSRKKVVWLIAATLLIIILAPVAFKIWNEYRVASIREDEKPLAPYTLEEAHVLGGGWNIYWVDNETLFFEGKPMPSRSDYDTLYKLSKTQESLFLWKIGESAKPYAEDEWNKGYFCAADGNLYYRIDEDIPYTSKEKIGLIKWKYDGKGQVIKVSSKDLQNSPINDGEGFNACRFNFPAVMTDRLWASDDRGEYVIDFGFIGVVLGDAKANMPPIYLKRLGDASEVELHIPRNEITKACTQYFSFSSYFLLWDCTADGNESIKKWEESNCRPYWIVNVPSGRTERQCVPFGHHSDLGFKLLPTKQGMFFSTSALKTWRGKSTGDAGIYKFENGKPVRILKGATYRERVSPDGCKIAFEYALHSYRSTDRSVSPLDLSGLISVKVLNVCPNSKT